MMHNEQIRAGTNDSQEYFDRLFYNVGGSVQKRPSTHCRLIGAVIGAVHPSEDCERVR
jgi:hypothetical protein